MIPTGIVDNRPIQDLEATDLDGFQQVHLFAGVGGWSLALELADWPAAWPIWTGSCPCQPFSTAGKQKGIEDDRHLWPYFQRLVAELHPPIIVGEQVSSPLGLDWLDGVFLDLENLGYAVGACDLPAASVGAPHIRQRLWWLAYSDRGRLDPLRRPAQAAIESASANQLTQASRLGDAERQPNI